MNLRNNFNREELARYYTYNYTCWWCGKSHTNCFHHILGRNTKHILSSAPLNNNECHLPIHPKLMKFKNRKMLLRKTLKYLLSQGYVLTEEKDGEFLRKNRKYYED